jgi:hypothetical protein
VPPVAVVAMVAVDDSDSMQHLVVERAAVQPVALPYAVVVADVVAVVMVEEHFEHSDSVATALETTHQMTERTHRPNRVAEAAA